MCEDLTQKNKTAICYDYKIIHILCRKCNTTKIQECVKIFKVLPADKIVNFDFVLSIDVYLLES